MGYQVIESTFEKQNIVPQPERWARVFGQIFKKGARDYNRQKRTPTPSQIDPKHGN